MTIIFELLAYLASKGFSIYSVDAFRLRLRNEFAQCVITNIKEVEISLVRLDDMEDYFTEAHQEVATLDEAKLFVEEWLEDYSEGGD